MNLVDGQTAEAQTIVLAEGKLTVRDAQGGEAGAWPVEEVARIQFRRPSAEDSDVATPDEPKPQAAESPAADVVLTVGGPVSGTVVGFDGKTFTLTGTEFGDLQLPLELVCVVRLAGAESGTPGAEESRTDVVVLANGDRLPGTVNSMDAKTVEFHSETLGDRSLERSRVTAIQVAAPSRGRPKAALPVLRVTTDAGNSLELGSLATDGDALRGLLGGTTSVAIPTASVQRIDVIGGRLVPLETLKPAAYEQQSLDVLTWSIQTGRNVLGEPMRLRDELDRIVAADSGIGVHAPCRVAYDLGGSYQRFMATAGIDESAGKYADVNLVVKVDGKEVFRADHVKWQQPARQINVSVAGAKRLELIAEAGEHFDVQDRVNWAQARLLRAKGSK
ncbi:MAG: NPCBM/NEW2 domain-containing protein [Planctomycetes bacterium]|nr:NPCBM/NEW2 domain-containing protein [Planctomycetota bacterium]